MIVQHRTQDNLDPDQLTMLQLVINHIDVNAKGAELGPVLETIENALRADQAVLIDGREQESGVARGD